MNNEPEQTEAARQASMDDQHAAFLQQAREYLSIKEAARMMGVSTRSVYGYIHAGKLLSVRVGTSISVSAASVRAYQRTCVGRPRQRLPIWRVPVAQNLQYLLTITAHVRQGQQEQLLPRLEEIRLSGRHRLPGTVARYIVRDKAKPEQLQLVLVWRQHVMPPEEQRAEALVAFQAELADLVVWETASATEGCVVMNT